MPISTKKPATTPDDFVSGAKADAAARKEYTRDKTFLLRIPAELHEQAREKAADERISLHEFILQAMATAISK